MSKLLRTTLKILAVAVVVIGVFVGVLLYVVDPGRYRAEVESSVYESTGLQLTIAGDMALTYQPNLGITLNDVRLRNPQRPQELASAPRVNLRVDPAALLTGRLVVEELHVEDLHVNWYTDNDGNSLWATERLTTLRDETAGGAIADPDSPETRFNFIAVSGASVDIQNLQRGYYYSLRNLNLSSQDSNLAFLPFPVQASFQLVTPQAPSPWPVTLSTDARLDLDAGNLEISELQLALTPALLEGSISIDNLFDDYAWQARLTSSEFALDDLVDNLFGEAEESAPPTLPGTAGNNRWQTQLRASIGGDATQITLTELATTLDSMRLEMEGQVRFSNGLLPTNARFTVQTNALDLSPYLPAAASTADGSAMSAEIAGTATLQGVADPAVNGRPDNSAGRESALLSLPLAARLPTGINVQGTIDIDSLFVAGLQFGSMNLFTNVESGILDIELQPTTLLDGTIDGHLRINSVPTPSQMKLEWFATDIDVADLNLPPLVPGTLAGRLNLESRYSGSGLTVGDWLASANGGTSFTIANSAVDIGIIKQVFTSIAVLSPRGETIQQWPDIIRFNDLIGFVTVTDGVHEGQQVKLRMDNFDVSGSGGIDPAALTFNYDLLFTVLGAPYPQTIPINNRYNNVSWPVQCSAAFQDPVNRLCRPDLAQAREIFTQLGENSLQYRLDEVITDEAPEALQNSSRELLRNLYPDQPPVDEPPAAANPL